MDPGLGNEMFQYAMGRALAVRLGRPLVLDISLFFESPGWSFNIPCFRLGQQRVRDCSLRSDGSDADSRSVPPPATTVSGARCFAG